MGFRRQGRCARKCYDRISFGGVPGIILEEFVQILLEIPVLLADLKQDKIHFVLMNAFFDGEQFTPQVFGFLRFCGQVLLSLRCALRLGLLLRAPIPKRFQFVG